MVVCATGQLNAPVVPDVAGAEDFAGTAFHSARWRHDHDLDGRDVAVVGTGASVIQIVPGDRRAGALADHLPALPGVRDRQARPGLPGVRAGRLRAPAGRGQGLPRLALREDGQPLSRLRAGQPGRGRLLLRWFTRTTRTIEIPGVPDEAIRPDYPVGCKRLLISNDYYDTLARPNVRIVTAPVERITAGRGAHPRRRRAPGRHPGLGDRLRRAELPRRPRGGRHRAGLRLPTLGRGRRGLPGARRCRASRTSSCSTARTPTWATPRSCSWSSAPSDLRGAAARRRRRRGPPQRRGASAGADGGRRAAGAATDRPSRRGPGTAPAGTRPRPGGSPTTGRASPPSTGGGPAGRAGSTGQLRVSPCARQADPRVEASRRRRPWTGWSCGAASLPLGRAGGVVEDLRGGAHAAPAASADLDRDLAGLRRRGGHARPGARSARRRRSRPRPGRRPPRPAGRTPGGTSRSGARGRACPRRLSAPASRRSPETTSRPCSTSRERSCSGSRPGTSRRSTTSGPSRTMSTGGTKPAAGAGPGRRAGPQVRRTRSSKSRSSWAITLSGSTRRS